MFYIFLGTKAQLIKMGPVMKKMQDDFLDYKFIFTGQHKETIDDIIDNFQIKKPDINLYDKKDITGILQMFIWSIKIIIKCVKNKKNIFPERGIILIHGDTISTVIGAIIGKLNKLKVAHIESGLRSFNIFHPFPEEINRIITFYLSDYYFCPGDWAINNLKKFKGKKINTKYNTSLDSLNLAKDSHLDEKIIPCEKYVICSIHRFENIFFKKRLNFIIDKIIEISKNTKVLFILHPPTIKKLKQFDIYKKLEHEKNIELRPRYDYFSFTKLLDKCEFVITDGGSNQEECFYLKKPCLLMRKATERNEGINKNVIISKYNTKIIDEFLSNYQNYKFDSEKFTDSPSDIIINYLKNI